MRRSGARSIEPPYVMVVLIVVIGNGRVSGQWLEQQELAVSGTVGDWFGNCVAVSGDTALVGAPFSECGAGDNCGSAYVFVRSGSVWSQQQELTAPVEDANDLFGYSVAVDADTAVVAASRRECGASNYCGSVYVFVRSGSIWSFQQELTAPDANADSEFGYSVSISGDTVLVGADRHGCGPGKNYCGKAYVFVRSGALWTFQDELVPSDLEAGDGFGHRVGVSGDTAVVGAKGHQCEAGGDDCGAAYVFVRSGSSWTEQKKLTAADPEALDLFGFSVSVSGETLVATAIGDDGHGSAYVFGRSGGVWTQQQKLTPMDVSGGDQFGQSVSINGNRALVGSVLGDCPGGNCGSAYLFVRSGGTWTEQQKLTASNAANGDWFGQFVSLDRNTALVGAPRVTCADGNECGSAYAFSFNHIGAPAVSTWGLATLMLTLLTA